MDSFGSSISSRTDSFFDGRRGTNIDELNRGLSTRKTFHRSIFLLGNWTNLQRTESNNFQGIPSLERSFFRCSSAFKSSSTSESSRIVSLSISSSIQSTSPSERRTTSDSFAFDQWSKDCFSLRMEWRESFRLSLVWCEGERIVSSSFACLSTSVGLDFSCGSIGVSSNLFSSQRFLDSTFSFLSFLRRFFFSSIRTLTKKWASNKLLLSANESKTSTETKLILN